jgi:rhodanese-related sulfurtransferase
MAVTQISPAALAQALEEGSVQLIDVREQNEWDNARIEGASLMPLSRFSPEQIVPEADKQIVFMCAGGVRSQNAAELVSHFRKLDVVNLTGGISAWAQAGLPVLRD